LIMTIQVVFDQAKCKIKQTKKSFNQSQECLDRKSVILLLVPAAKPASWPRQGTILAVLFRPRSAPLTTGCCFGKSLRAAVGIRQWLAPLDGGQAETLWFCFTQKATGLRCRRRWRARVPPAWAGWRIGRDPADLQRAAPIRPSTPQRGGNHRGPRRRGSRPPPNDCAE